MATWTPLFRKICSEYTLGKKSKDHNHLLSQRELYLKLYTDSHQYGGTASMADVISKLREDATAAGILDSAPLRSRGEDIENRPCLIPDGATNRQIIDMLEQASKAS